MELMENTVDVSDVSLASYMPPPSKKKGSVRTKKPDLCEQLHQDYCDIKSKSTLNHCKGNWCELQRQSIISKSTDKSVRLS